MIQWIDNQPQLDRALAMIRETDAIAIDTEADSLHSYFDKVCLIQISIPESDFVIDPLAKIDLTVLGEILGDDSKKKVLHGADYDLRIMQRDFGFRINSMVDTMICAQLAGYDAVGLAALMKRHFDLSLDKTHQRADWAMRPLPPQMLDYAALDTRYLLQLSARMQLELEALGRWEWAREEFTRLEDIRFREADDNGEAWRRLKGLNLLPRRALAAVAELYEWRDGTARRLDRPPFRVLGNETLLEIARTLPQDRDQLSTIQGMSKYVMGRYGDEIMAALSRAAAVPETELPNRNEPKPWIRDRALETRTEKLKKVRDKIAATLKIDPSVLAPRHVLSAIAGMNPPTPDKLAEIGAMRNWQRQVAGDALIAAVST